MDELKESVMKFWRALHTSGIDSYEFNIMRVSYRTTYGLRNASFRDYQTGSGSTSLVKTIESVVEIVPGLNEVHNDLIANL